MPIQVGTGAGEYPPVIQYVSNGEPADEITFNRPHGDTDRRTEVLRSYCDSLGIDDIAGLGAALNGSAPLNPNLSEVANLDFANNTNTLFAVDGTGHLVLVPNNVQGETNTASNVGSGEGAVFKLKNLLDLQFRTVKAGLNVSVETVGDHVVVSSTPGEILSLTKRCKNTTGAPIPAKRAVAWLDDGTIAPADANEIDLADLCGVTAEAIPDGSFGRVYKVGNAPGVLAGLGAKPGQWVYLGQNPGEITLTAPPGINDSIIALGRAEPPDGIATATAEDLYLMPAYVSEGGVA